MRTCATASLVAILGIPLVVTFAACAGGSQTNGTTPDKSTTEPKKDAPTEVRKDEPKTETPGQTTTTDAKPTATVAPKSNEPTTTAECVAMLPEEVPEAADAGIVMNNAQTAADAGKSDRFAPLNQLVKSRRKGFRCCFDIWAKSHPKEPGKVLLAFELDPEGQVKSVTAKKEESSPMATEILPCLTEVTKSISFPKSPSGRDTKFTYPFDFKPH